MRAPTYMNFSGGGSPLIPVHHSVVRNQKELIETPVLPSFSFRLYGKEGMYNEPRPWNRGINLRHVKLLLPFPEVAS